MSVNVSMIYKIKNVIVADIELCSMSQIRVKQELRQEQEKILKGYYEITQKKIKEWADNFEDYSFKYAVEFLKVPQAKIIFECW